MGSKSTPEEREQASFLRDAGMSYIAIGRMLGRPRPTIVSWLRTTFREQQRKVYRKCISTPVGDAKFRLRSARRAAKVKGHAACTATPEEVISAKTDACPGCGRRGERMVMDHCHATGRLRGFICRDCNIALGHVRDETKTLLKLVEYLQ